MAANNIETLILWVANKFKAGESMAGLFVQSVDDLASFDKSASLMNSCVYFACPALKVAVDKGAVVISGQGAELVVDQIGFNLELRRALAKNNLERVKSLMAMLGSALDSVMAAHPAFASTYTVTFNPTADKPQAQQIEIISMPTRETSTTVERSSNGDILKTKQIEQDTPTPG